MPRVACQAWVDRSLPGQLQLLFYCAFGERSAMTVHAAQDAGLSSARHIKGGMDAWKKAAE